MQKLETYNGRRATDEEIASELEITVEEYEKWQSQMKITNLVSLDEFLEQGSEIQQPTNSSSHFEQPEKVLEKQDFLSKLNKEILVEVLETLTENERKVIILYYFEELTLKEISHILEVSESRISQLHTKALQKMKKKLGNKEFF